jgi:peptidoglycan/LPS O-acetylase OafA/YrhL
LRGLAALYVVLHHAALEVSGTALGHGAELIRGVLRHGHFAVAVFIVLSGYCLMRPVARDASGRMRIRGGTLGYLGRRARRILPPYYAALVLCWLLIGLVPALQRPDRVRWDRALPAFSPGVVVSHLFLVHNLDERWIFKIDPPLWSVATEGQIYLFFPALLAVWRRHGRGAAVAAGFAAGSAIAALAGWLDNPALAKLCPWYLGLFALGMAGALDGAARSGHARRPESPWLGVLLTTAAVLLAWQAGRHGADAAVMMADLLVGAAATGLIVGCARRAERERGGAGAFERVVRLLGSRGAVTLGTFSYSLYLIHFPLLAGIGQALRDLGWGAEPRLAAMILVATPLCTLAAYVFHRAFERPFRLTCGGDDATSRRGWRPGPRRGRQGSVPECARSSPV